ncbi:RDD family protein [Olleya sp. R77988]|uniref:RDD family protein n=1 Tax=Olleya sp. R77988 TaxID=3093875 RepID=UPI0037C5283D
MKKHLEKASFFIEQKIKFILPIFIVITSLLHYNRVFGNYDSFLFKAQRYFQSISLDFLNIDLFKFNFTNSHGDFTRINVLEILFLSILIIAYILYHLSKGKEKRLLQFCFSLFFMFSVVRLFLFFFFVFKNLAIDFYGLTYLITVSFWLLLFYLIVKILSKDEKLKTQKYKLLDQYPEFKLKRATKWQRFFHLIVDAWLGIMVTSNLIRILPRKPLNALVDLIGQRYTLTIVVLVFITIYYIIVELVFKSSPAKYLTQTKIVSLSGQPITSGNIIIRSFSRRIPFNPFSFLGNESDLGWHDSLSKTTVVQLKRQGKHGSWYWLIIPFFLLITAFIYFGNQYLKDYRWSKIRENQYKNQIYDINNKLNNLSESDFITIGETNDSYSSNYYLKVSFITEDSVECFVIDKNTYKANTLRKADQFYGGYYYDLDIVTLSKSQLEAAVCDVSNFDNDFIDCGTQLLKDKGNMRIKKIESNNQPSLVFDNINFYNNRKADKSNFTIKLKNTINTLSILNIEVDNKEVEITSKLPITSSYGYSDSTYTIQGKGLVANQDATFKISILDKATNKRFLYQLTIEGKYKKEFKLIKKT